MQEVACFHCRNIVTISPDAERCSVCGEDLKHLLLPETVSSYFYERASARAAKGDPTSGLVEAERGLTYRSSAELHLLAAILAQQLGKYDQMRFHVAAIPVDDGLRPEAEWLLRSHQARQRALREGSKMERNQVADEAAGWLESLLSREGGPPPAQAKGKRANWQFVALPVVVGVLSLVWLLFSRPGLATWLEGESQAQERTLPEVSAPEPAEAASEPAPEIQEEKSLLPTPTPSDKIPEDLVIQPTGSQELADSNPRHVVVVRSAIFDLKTFLRNAGYAELAALPVEARLQDGKLILQGTVNLDVQRRTLIELVKTVPGVSEISEIDLLLRPLPTYTVQEGDTLWTIVYNIYGSVDRMEEFYEVNLNVLPSPDALPLGTVLQVPPLETP